jgi:hypothetical protein
LLPLGSREAEWGAMPVAVGVIAAVNKKHHEEGDKDDDNFTPLPLPPAKVCSVATAQGAPFPGRERTVPRIARHPQLRERACCKCLIR